MIVRKAESRTVSIGLIGVDSSHSVTFAKLANVIGLPTFPHARVVSAYAGRPSTDYEPSWRRFDKFLVEVQSLGVQLLPSSQDVAESCDVVLITSVDPRHHLSQFKEVAGSRTPVFIDKPLAHNGADAREIVSLAEKTSTPLVSCSSMRFDASVARALGTLAPSGVERADVHGPAHGYHPVDGLYTRAVHLVEVLYQALGGECRRVSTQPDQAGLVITADWSHGRVGRIVAHRQSRAPVEGSVSSNGNSRQFEVSGNPQDRLSALLTRVMSMAIGEVEDLPRSSESLEVIKFIDAVAKSRDTHQPVML